MSIGRMLRRTERGTSAAVPAASDKQPLVVITGASEGIGLALAHGFARSGFDLLLIARRVSALDSAAAEILRTGVTGRLGTLPLDITDATALQQIDAKVASLGGYIDILVNNAGIGLAGSFAEQSADDIEALVVTNVMALTRLCRHVLPHQIARRRGGIINVASIGGLIPGPYQAAYYASKAYVVSLSEALAVETASSGVHVMAVLPGPVDTAFHAKMGANKSLYRMLIPSQSAAQVATYALWAFRLRFRIAVPGVFNMLMVMLLRLLPHRLLMPLLSLLLRPMA